MYLKLETVARGLGFTTVATSGNEVVRWNRVRKYLNEFGFPNKLGKEDYIPENIFYRMQPQKVKGVSQTDTLIQERTIKLKKFKRWVTSEVLPSIRKHGAYMTPETIEKTLLSPDFIIRLAETLKSEQEKNKRLTVVNAALTKEINEWDNRSLVTHLIRKYGSYQYNNKFGFTYQCKYQTRCTRQ